MLTIPVLCEFRSMSRQTISFEKDGKKQDFERVQVCCESVPDGVAFNASPSFGVVVPVWVAPEMRGKRVLLSVNDLRTEKGNTSVRFTQIVKDAAK